MIIYYRADIDISVVFKIKKGVLRRKLKGPFTRKKVRIMTEEVFMKPL